MVPFVRIKLDMSTLFGCGIIPAFFAYSFIESPISFLLTTVFLKLVGKLET